MSPSSFTALPTAPGYPPRLAALTSPPRLWGQGRLAAAGGSRVVAVVGARAADAEALAMATALVTELAGDTVIVSGGALGIDSAAHTAALNAGGTTVAVLGCGLDIIYPARNAELFAAIATRGALLSPFAPGTPPRPGHFVRRNGIIAALADAVVVIGAGARSGALHTAHAAAKLGRVVAASPGWAGCDALIASGAAMVERAGDLAAALAGAPRKPVVVLPPAGGVEARVLEVIGSAPLELDQIIDAVGEPARQVARSLTALETRGLVRLLAGQCYVRTSLATVRAVG